MVEEVWKKEKVLGGILKCSKTAFLTTVLLVRQDEQQKICARGSLSLVCKFIFRLYFEHFISDFINYSIISKSRKSFCSLYIFVKFFPVSLKTYKFKLLYFWKLFISIFSSSFYLKMNFSRKSKKYQNQT